MSQIKAIIIQALYVSVPYSIFAAIVSLSFSLRVQTYDSEGGPAGLATGFEAILSLISRNGLQSFLSLQAPSFLMFFAFTFGALLIQGFIYEKKNPS